MDNAAVGALREQALDAADDLLREYGSGMEPELQALMRPLLGIAWVRGRQVGSNEAREVVRQFKARLAPGRDA